MSSLIDNHKGNRSSLAYMRRYEDKSAVEIRRVIKKKCDQIALLSEVLEDIALRESKAASEDPIPPPPKLVRSHAIDIGTVRRLSDGSIPLFSSSDIELSI